MRQVWGVVGDALNPITEAIRLEDRIEWVGVRHEEAAAFAAGAQAQLIGTLGVCMGTVGPGSLHLLNGLYDAKKSHAPVLAICGQVPTSEIGSNFFQEVDNNAVFADVSVFHATVTAGSQMPYLLEQAVNAAFAKRGVAVLTVPGDVGELDVDGPPARFARAGMRSCPSPARSPRRRGAQRRRDRHHAGRLRCPRGPQRGAGGRDPCRTDGSDPEGQDGLEYDNPYQVGQSGLIGNPAAHQALTRATPCSWSAPTSRTPTGIPRARRSSRSTARMPVGDGCRV